MKNAPIQPTGARIRPWHDLVSCSLHETDLWSAASHQSVQLLWRCHSRCC